MARYQFEFLSAISDIVIIARGEEVRVRNRLNNRFGRGRWRKMKGKAIIRYSSGEVWLAEIHWYEAHGIGQRDHKAVYDLEQIS